MNLATNILGFDKIIEQLTEYAVSEQVKQEIMQLTPFLEETKCEVKMRETTEARRLLDSLGLPPLSTMQGIRSFLDRVEKGTMLLPNEFEALVSFIKGCQYMKRYLERGEYLECYLTSYSKGFYDLSVLREEIEMSIHNNRVVDEASSALKNIRRELESKKEGIKAKLEKLLQSKKMYLADYYVVERSGHYAMAVKKEYKYQIEGSVIDTSRTGNTLFIEPSIISKMQGEMNLLEIEEDNEVRKVLYTLTNDVEDLMTQIKANMEMMEALDMAFAKGKLSQEMNARPVPIKAKGELVINKGRHPLLDKETCVPLDFRLDEKTRGIIITGPNTGGKTVALKTVGLLTMMAQSGLHVPVEQGSSFVMRSQVLCDIGDGQSIEESLSTFSAHIKNVIEIMKETNEESLVLLDELGSGTDPAEGMGIAVATLEALRQTGALIVATTHYPEVKEYAKEASGFENARMRFDKKSLKPLYQLEIGEAGESCAFYIAERLGFPKELIEFASGYTYKERLPKKEPACQREKPELKVKSLNTQKKGHKIKAKEIKKSTKTIEYRLGDSVQIEPDKEKGIVFHAANDKGEVGVQIKGEKKWIPYKRIKLVVSACELYPPDYDFSIIFDSVENRKARNKIRKGKNAQTHYNSEEEERWATGKSE